MTTGGVPLTTLTRSTVDISALLRFHFWQKGPSDSPEAVGHIVGISEHCGHALTWKILTVDSNSIIFRSLVRPFSSEDPNLRAEMLGGEKSDQNPTPIIKSRHDSDHGSKHISTPIIMIALHLTAVKIRRMGIHPVPHSTLNAVSDSGENKENGEPPSAVFNPERCQ